MLKSLKLVALFFILITSSLVSAQSRSNTTRGVKYTANVDAPLKTSELEMIREVYQDYAQSQILDNPIRVKHIKHLLRNRLRIIRIEIKEKQRPCSLLSEIELFDDYNKDLRRDKVFNKDAFNPLKYRFDFFAEIPVMYRVDGTNYFIQIKSQFQ